MIKKLQWDSDFFNIKIGQVDYKEFKEDSLDYDVLYVNSSEDFELKIEYFENTFTETKVIFFKSVEEMQPISKSIFNWEEVTANKEELYLLAYESGKNSRFLLDKKFGEIKFKKLYQTWVDNSINKKFADGILVYFDEHILKGFVSYKTKEASLSVGLISVNPNFQGIGIGTKLLYYLENIALNNALKEVIIPTQLANIQACNFYKKQGYCIQKTTVIKHFWKI
jgi:ribosomal protein S18 acetylase RimI-like enzyme